MGGVHQFAQAVWAAVGVLHGEGEDTVVAPVARAGKLRDRHELDRGHAQVLQVRQVRDDRRERPRLGKRANMHFVEHPLPVWWELPRVVLPGEGRAVHDLRWPMYTFRLEAGSRVGQQRIVQA